MSSPPLPDCASDDVLTASIDGALGEPMRSRLFEHLEICDACRRRHQALDGGQFPRIENYTVIERIGRGGFGVVYRAIHHAKQRTEALKVLYATTPLRAAYFENEVHLIASLRHPNIATLYEAQLASPPLYYSMELVEGERLNEYLAAHRVPVDERIRLIRTVAQAVEYLHAHGVVHRDIKPQNILVDRTGQPRIVDFGIGKRLGLPAQPQPGAADGAREGPIGTLGYIAPEQAERQNVDGRADIFALGALLYHCVTGRPAPRATEPPHAIGDVLRRRGIRRARDLAAIISHCVAHDPDQRYASCAQFVADLDRFVEGRWVAARVEQSRLVRVARVAAFLLRKHTAAVQFAVLALSVTWLVLGFAALRPHVAIGMAGAGGVVIVGLDPATDEAVRAGRYRDVLPDLDPQVPKSYRLLHARVLTAIARASPLAVVLDYYFPDCQPSYDAALVDAIRRIRAPVVVAAHEFDVNGEPLTCDAIREAAHGFGAIVSAAPGAFSTELEMTACIERGFGPPIPGLAVAGFAAARRPDGRARLVVDRDGLELRYEKRAPRPGEPRWLETTDRIPLHRGARPDDAQHLIAGDRALMMRVPIPNTPTPLVDSLSYAAILEAADDQLRAWLDHRAVILGGTLPGVDEHTLIDGRRVHGVETHARALETLLGGARLERLSVAGIFVRVVLAGTAALALVRLVPLRPPLRLRGSLTAALTTIVASVALAAFAVVRWSTPWVVEPAIVLAALLVCGAALLAARVSREFAGQIAATAATALGDERSSVPSTRVVEARTSSTTVPDSKAAGEPSATRAARS